MIKKWILMKTDEGPSMPPRYVAPPESPHSYVEDPFKANRYRTRSEAMADACVENETAVDLTEIFETGP